MRREVAKDRCFSSNRTVEGDFEFDCSKHCRDIVLLGMYLFRRAHRLLGGVEQLRSDRKGLPALDISMHTMRSTMSSYLDGKAHQYQRRIIKEISGVDIDSS